MPEGPKSDYGKHHHREECECELCYPPKREDPKTGVLVIRSKHGEPVSHTVERSDELIVNGALIRFVRIRDGKAKFVVVHCPIPEESA